MWKSMVYKWWSRGTQLQSVRLHSFLELLGKGSSCFCVIGKLNHQELLWENRQNMLKIGQFSDFLAVYLSPILPYFTAHKDTSLEHIPIGFTSQNHRLGPAILHYVQHFDVFRERISIHFEVCVMRTREKTKRKHSSYCFALQTVFICEHFSSSNSRAK